jgi:hypothetical protein
MVANLSQKNVAKFPVFLFERYIFKLPKRRPRQEVNSTEQFNTVPSLYSPKSMVSRSDGYIDAHSRVEPLYEELDHRPAQEVEVSHDVPPLPYVNTGGATVSAANPVRPPHYENAENGKSSK